MDPADVIEKWRSMMLLTGRNINSQTFCDADLVPQARLLQKLCGEYIRVVTEAEFAKRRVKDG